MFQSMRHDDSCNTSIADSRRRVHVWSKMMLRSQNAHPSSQPPTDRPPKTTHNSGAHRHPRHNERRYSGKTAGKSRKTHHISPATPIPPRMSAVFHHAPPTGTPRGTPSGVGLLFSGVSAHQIVQRFGGRKRTRGVHATLPTESVGSVAYGFVVGSANTPQ